MPSPAVTTPAEGPQQGCADSGEDPDSPGPHPAVPQPGPPLCGWPGSRSRSGADLAVSSLRHRFDDRAPALPLAEEAGAGAAAEGRRPGPDPAATDPSDLLAQPLAWLAGVGLALLSVIVPVATVIGDRSIGPGSQPLSTPSVPFPLARDGSSLPAPITGSGTGESAGGNSSRQSQ